MSEDVKRFDCTNGGAAWCQGCYTMSEDEHGDYVQAEDYDALLAEIEALRAEVAEARDGWHMANGVAELAMKHRDAAEARAERLAEALRMMVEMVEMDGFGKGAAMDTARAALDQEGGK